MRFLIILFFVITSVVVSAPGNTEIYLILFDVTGSMEGKGDGAGIKVFDKAKEAVTFFVNEIPDDNYLFVYPFHAGLSSKRFQSIIRSGYGRKKAVEFIKTLKAEGSNTWLTESYRAALSETKEYLRLHRVSASKVHVFFFTDGKGNHVTDNNIDNFVKVHRDALIDLPLNTKFVAIGDIFLPEQIQKLLDQEIGIYSFQRENFSRINAFITAGKIDTTGGNVKIPYKIVSDAKMEGQKINYSMNIDQITGNIKPEFTEEELNQVNAQLEKCRSFGNTEIERLNKFITVNEPLSNDEIVRFSTRIKDCETVSQKNKEKLEKLLRKDYLFTEQQVDKLKLDSVMFAGQGTQFTSTGAVDTININSEKLNSIVDSLFNTAVDSSRIKEFLENKELTGKVFLTQDAAAAGSEELVMFPDNKFPFAVPHNPKNNEVKKKEAETSLFDKDLFGIPSWLVFILAGIVLAAGVLILLRYYQSEKLKGRTAAYKDTDIKEYIQGKPEVMDVCQILTRILQQAEPKLQGIHLETRVKPMNIAAYPESVKFVLSELINNAADAAGSLIFEDNKKISIESFEDAKYATIRITNTGGVAVDKEGLIFRDRYSTKNNKGFGLIRCHKIMAANKGRIRYEGVSKLQRNEMTNVNEVVNTATIMTVDFAKKLK